MTRRFPHRLLSAAALVGAVAGCSGTNAVSQSVNGSLGYGLGDQATTWISPAHRKPVPDVTGTLLDGSSFDLSQWSGHVVVVNFWGSWCSPCRQETAALSQVYRDDAKLGVEFLGVDVREDRARAISYVRAHHVSYPSLYDESNLVALQFHGLPPNATPTTIVLDRDGRIAARHSGAILYTTLRDLVARVVSEKTA